MRHARTYPTELYLCTTLVRQDNDGEVFECDAIVYFDARMTARGCPPSWTDPGWAAEYEVAFRTADLDGLAQEAPGPLTEVEVATLRQWFEAHAAEAYECANDNYFRE